MDDCKTGPVLGGFGKILAAGALAMLATTASGQQLYENESIVDLAGFPAVSYFVAGDADQPLIVFVPGAHHAARIAYGGHEGANGEDFLAHWLTEKGYNVLALSYPIETEGGLIAENRPEFTAQDWGRQIAEATAEIVETHGLDGEIYLAAWSMAGKVIQPAHAALAEAGHPLSAAFSFAATPGIPGIIALTQEFDRAESGYADRVSSYDGWFNQILANQEDDDRPIIPEDIFRSEYVGNISINLQGYGEVYGADGDVTIDHMAQAADYGAFAFDDFPLVVTFQVDQRLDARHAINDQSYWTLYNTHTLFSEFARRGVSVNDVSEDAWQDAIALALDAGPRLRVDVGGNHFFFVGEDGARATADGIDEAIEKVRAWNAEIDRIVAQ